MEATLYIKDAEGEFIPYDESALVSVTVRFPDKETQTVGYLQSGDATDLVSSLLNASERKRQGRAPKK